MIAVYPFCQKDAEQLYQTLQWTLELGPQPFPCLLITESTVDLACVRSIQGVAEKIFTNVRLKITPEVIPDWIRGANSFFKAAAQACAGDSFWWNEPDCIPLKQDWLKHLSVAYKAFGKPFMGAFVKPEQPGFPSPYMEGCAIYPPDCWERIKSYWDDDKCWCFTTAPAVIPNATNTPLIHQIWGAPGFFINFVEVKTATTPPQDWSLDQIRGAAVVFHRSKKDSGLIPCLRRKMFPDKPDYSRPPVFVQMGRYGDLILLMPAFKAWSDRSGFKTIVVTTREFGNVLEGASYIQPIMLGGYTWFDIGKAFRWAIGQYGDAICTQLHGRGIEHKPDSLPSYSLSMWKRTGLMEEYMTLPLVFDQRSRSREEVLRKQWFRTDKPKILYNFTGWTSPFDYANEVISILRQFPEFELVDLGKIVAHRVYDLLGLYDHATGVLTSDTMTMHLAPASKTPYIAFVRGDGQSGSVPKGNVVLQMKYHDTPAKLNQVALQMEFWSKGIRAALKAAS